MPKIYYHSLNKTRLAFSFGRRVKTENVEFRQFPDYMNKTMTCRKYTKSHFWKLFLHILCEICPIESIVVLDFLAHRS